MNTPELQWACDPAINWTWYLGYVLNDDSSITIHVFDRLHHERHAGKHPDTHDQHVLSEGAERVVQSAKIYNTLTKTLSTHDVANKQYVFSYGKFNDASNT